MKVDKKDMVLIWNLIVTPRNINNKKTSLRKKGILENKLILKQTSASLNQKSRNKKKETEEIEEILESCNLLVSKI